MDNKKRLFEMMSKLNRNFIFEEEKHPEGEHYKLQLDQISSKAKKVDKMIENSEELPAWIQDKISLSLHNMDAICDYFKLKNNDEEAIEGGLADNMSPTDFNIDSLVKGFKEELNHHASDDPKAALEITMDNLIADPNYYNKESQNESKEMNEGFDLKSWLKKEIESWKEAIQMMKGDTYKTPLRRGMGGPSGAAGAELARLEKIKNQMENTLQNLDDDQN
ncbi:MAG: hypothetical protein ACOC33_03090 [bacterium]